MKGFIEIKDCKKGDTIINLAIIESVYSSLTINYEDYFAPEDQGLIDCTVIEINKNKRIHHYITLQPYDEIKKLIEEALNE